MKRLAWVAFVVTGCASTPPCPAPAPPPVANSADVRGCASDFNGPVPAIVRVHALVDVVAELTRSMPNAARDVEMQLEAAHGAAFLVDAMAGTEHEGDGYYYRTSAVFRLRAGLLIVKDVALGSHTIPAPGSSEPRRLSETSSIEILNDKIGHVRVASEPVVHHFIDLENGRYLRGVVELGRPLTAWTLDTEGASSGECQVYWF